MSIDHYIYRVTWSPEERKHLATCAEFPALSWLADTPEDALIGVRDLVRDAIANCQIRREPAPDPLSERHYTGEFIVHVPPETHRELAIEAAGLGMSLSQYARMKLLEGRE